jgi:hypothetical protein
LTRRFDGVQALCSIEVKTIKCDNRQKSSGAIQTFSQK